MAATADSQELWDSVFGYSATPVSVRAEASELGSRRPSELKRFIARRFAEARPDGYVSELALLLGRFGLASEKRRRRRCDDLR